MYLFAHKGFRFITSIFIYFWLHARLPGVIISIFIFKLHVFIFLSNDMLLREGDSFFKTVKIKTEKNAEKGWW